jgi:hypothetical protein
MKSAINDALARQRSGEPPTARDRNGNRNARPRRAEITEVERQIAGLVALSTHDLRVAWRQPHRARPPPDLNRDLLIRALAHQLQERAHGGVSRALRRRLQSLTGEFEKLGAPFDPGLVPKTGTRLVRQWHGYARTVLVREDGFEYEGQHYRSLTVIAERITGAHWSGPRFFGLTKRARALVGAQTGR